MYSSQDKEYYYLVDINKDFSARYLRAIRNIIEQGLEKGYNLIVLRLTSCPFIDSSAMGLIGAVNKKCSESGGRVCVLEPNKDVTEMMHMTGLDEMIWAFDSQNEMEAYFKECGFIVSDNDKKEAHVEPIDFPDDVSLNYQALVDLLIEKKIISNEELLSKIKEILNRE